MCLALQNVKWQQGGLRIDTLNTVMKKLIKSSQYNKLLIKILI